MLGFPNNYAKYSCFSQKETNETMLYILFYDFRATIVRSLFYPNTDNDSTFQFKFQHRTS